MLASKRCQSIVTLMCGVFLTSAVLDAQPCFQERSDTDDGSATSARAPMFLDAWKLAYPASTLPERMMAVAGSECFVCHTTAGFGILGNCYREDLKTLTGTGMSIEDAIAQLDGEDSDGDGFANGVEATTPRPEVGGVGYNPGLIGNTGTDPCSEDPEAPPTGMAETPPPPIPTVSEWGLAVTGLLVLGAGTLVLHRRRGMA